MERNYATQMDAARRGIVTPELKKVAEKEYMAVEDLMPLVASGKVAIKLTQRISCSQFGNSPSSSHRPAQTNPSNAAERQIYLPADRRRFGFAVL